jgi:single-strand DNA-binding protein
VKEIIMLNVVAIMGRLTADPEMKTTTNGVSVTSFTLAVDRSFSKDGERKADFIDCVAWRGTAEFICKHFTKGKLMAVDGAIQTRSYEDKNGNKRKTVEIVVANVNFCGDGKKAEAAPDAKPDDVQTEGFDELGDDLPF